MAAATKVELEKNRFFRILLRFLRLQVNHNLTTVNMRDSRPRRRPRRRFYDRRALILRAGNGAGIYGGGLSLVATQQTVVGGANSSCIRRVNRRTPVPPHA